MAGTQSGRVASKLEAILSPGGVLDEALEHYEYRPQQLEMARAVADSLRDRMPLIVEAATGTGKTLAYLIPALLSGRRVVVSTGTKALQEQLFFKDIPLLERCLSHRFQAVLLKGRKNYLCLHRFQEMERTKRFRRAADIEMWPEIRRWAKKTATGDRAEIDGLPDDYATWQELSVGSEACLGTKCSHWEECFVQLARRQAREADIIVVNHHLFFADLVLREGGFGEILPEYDAVIFDEAHHLEKVATDYFGLQVSNYRFSDLGGDVDRALDAEEMSSEKGGDVEKEIRQLRTKSGRFFDALREGAESGRQELREVLRGLDDDELERKRRALKRQLDKLGAALRTASLGEVGVRLAERCGELKRELEAVTTAEDARFAYIVERRERGVFMQAAPIDLASEMRTRLLDTQDTLIFTSATLATGGDFSFFKKRMGFEKLERDDGDSTAPLEVEELLLPPVFDYEQQCLLYVPRKLPAPKDPDFCKNVALIVEYLLGITEGRAFVLFTSYRNMRDVHGRLAEGLEYPVLLQGERSKRELLEVFRNKANAVLFATASFWEGVDVEGEALSLVVIDKLPFANPSDPLTRARFERADQSGGNSFFEISLPTAAISLRQGFGRLIRSRRDRGVVAILDSRIAHKSYGRYFLRSLPAVPVVWTAPQVKRWWRDRVEEGQPH